MLYTLCCNCFILICLRVTTNRTTKVVEIILYPLKFLKSRRYQIDVFYINKIHKQKLTFSNILSHYLTLSRQSEVIIAVHLIIELVILCREYAVGIFLFFTAFKCQHSIIYFIVLSIETGVGVNIFVIILLPTAEKIKETMASPPAIVHIFFSKSVKRVLTFIISFSHPFLIISV